MITFKGRHFKKDIIRAIKEHESGVKLEDICRSLGIPHGTFYNWRSKSERAACQLIGLSRTAYRYQLKERPDAPLRARLKALTAQYPRYSSLLLHNLLKGEGLVINKKRTYRIYTEEELKIRTKKRKKLQRPRLLMQTPSRTP